MKCHVFVDFDGTIATEDTTDRLLERFADPRWLEIEAEWKAGRIGSRECMVRQIDLVRATPQQYDEFVSRVEIDAAFAGFVRLCRDLGHAITVVSDGLDRTVASVLERNRLDLPFRANQLEWVGDDRWRLWFPYSRSQCVTLSGNCKCQFIEAERLGARILIGDGRSDFCVAGRADLVLSKGSLTRHCRDAGLSHIPFRDFNDACELLVEWLAARAPEARSLSNSETSRHG